MPRKLAAAGPVELGHVEYKIEILPGYIRAEMVERDTAEETAEFVQALLSALRAQAAARVLISTRASRGRCSRWSSGSCPKCSSS